MHNMFIVVLFLIYFIRFSAFSLSKQMWLSSFTLPGTFIHHFMAHKVHLHVYMSCLVNPEFIGERNCDTLQTRIVIGS